MAPSSTSSFSQMPVGVPTVSDAACGLAERRFQGPLDEAVVGGEIRCTELLC